MECVKAQKSGWYLFPWQNFFQKAIKPRDFVGLNNLAKKWRVKGCKVTINNITPQLKYKTQTSNQMSFPNVYFEMYEDTEYDLNGYNADFTSFDSGVQSYVRSSKKTDMDLKEWTYVFDPAIADSFLAEKETYCFNAANHCLMNGSGISFGRQVDQIQRVWVNPDKRWRHSHPPHQTHMNRQQVINLENGHNEDINYWGARQDTTPYGAPHAGFGGIGFPVQPMTTGELYDNTVTTQNDVLEGYPICKKDTITNGNNATKARTLGRGPLHENQTTNAVSYAHVGNCVADYMTRLPYYVKPPPLWLMRSVDYDEDQESSWTFNAVFHVEIEYVENQLGYWPLGWDIESNFGWCGTNAFNFTTAPSNHSEDGPPKKQHWWSPQQPWVNGNSIVPQYEPPGGGTPVSFKKPEEPPKKRKKLDN